MGTKFWLGSLKGRYNWEYLDVDGIIILKFILRRWECVNLIYLAKDRDCWWAFVNTVINHRVP
jgi:hypothetical protein